MLFPYPQSVELKTGSRGTGVRRESAPGLIRPDEYEIVMTEDGTLIRSASDSGFFYAEKTLKSLPADQIGRIHDWADVPLRIQMIDLKRIDWNFDYLLSLFPLFAEFKINACLIEYEDKFPYRFTDQIAVPSAFTREQLLELKRVAKENHVELIPLVQCFSHWEYILDCSAPCWARSLNCMTTAALSTSAEMRPACLVIVRSVRKKYVGKGWKNCTATIWCARSTR